MKERERKELKRRGYDLNKIERIEEKQYMKREDLNENALNKFQYFSQSLGTLFWQIGIYSVIQILAGFFLAVISVGMILSLIHETSLSAIFNTFQALVWTMLIASIILEGIFYFFLIKLIVLLRGAEKQGIPYRDKYRKSALFFMAGIILGVVFLVVAIIISNWILQIVREILNDPSFDVEDLEQVPPTAIISSLVEMGRILLSVAGFYYLKQNFEQLRGYMQNGGRIIKGLQLLISGNILLILGRLIALGVSLGSFLGLIGLLIIILGYFRISDGLKTTTWKL